MKREKKSTRKRRRGQVLEDAIFEVALGELAKSGYVNFSIERVASEAGTSKPVLYRRWPNRAQLVYAALRANQTIPFSQAPNTGSVRSDLMAILQRVSNMIEELSPEVIFGLAAELLHECDSSLFAEVHERTANIMSQILTSGIERGEIAAEKLTPRIAGLPFDLARYQLLVHNKPLTLKDSKEIIDRIFLPLVRAN